MVRLCWHPCCWFSSINPIAVIMHMNSQHQQGLGRHQMCVTVCAGATFDVLDDRSFDQFAHLPEHAFTSLNDQDRQIIRQRVMSWEG